MKSIFLKSIWSLLFLVASMGCSDDLSGTDGDTDSSGNGDSNGNGDTDTDSNGNSNGDTDSNGNGDLPYEIDGSDRDSDGWSDIFDCNDLDPDIYPGAPETAGDGIDSNCDGEDDPKDGGDGDTSSDGDVCAANDFVVTPVPVALMILQDMSGSMDPYYNDATGDWDDPDNPGRWSIAKPAITSLLNDYADYSEGNIEFGFDIFPNSSGTCSVSDPVIRDTVPGQSQSLAIIDMLYADNAPNGATPLRGAMDNFLNPDYAPNFLSPDRQSYLMIVSDGKDTCRNGSYTSSNGATAAQLGTKAEELLAAGVKTFVIGFGGGVDPAQLNAIASAGGTPFTSFLAADDQDSLEGAFSQIAASIISCDFEVPQQGADVDQDNVNFYLNGVVVPFDENCEKETGWTWTRSDLTEVRMCTAACDQLQKDKAELSATWGCPTIIIGLQ